MGMSPRGAFVLVAGTFLIAIGLSVRGIGGLIGLLQLFRGVAGGEGEGAGLRELLLPHAFEDFCIFMGAICILAVVVGLPAFRFSAIGGAMKIERKLDKEKVFKGEYCHVTLHVTNTTRTRIDFLEIYDPISEALQLAVGENYITTRIDPGQTISLSYILRTIHRGKFPIGPTRIIIYDRMGFYYEEETVGDATTILVLPEYTDIKRMDALSHRRQIGMLFGIHKTRQIGLGDRFHALRPYVPGDEFRRIDWKAFARTQKLIVREFEIERNIRVMILLDCSGSMGAGIPHNTKLDFAIRAAMLFAHMSLERRDFVGMTIYSDKVHHYIKTNSGKRTFFDILETLALVEPGGVANPLSAVNYVMRRETRPAFFVFLTDLEGARSERIIDGIRKTRSMRHPVTVLAPFGPFFEARLEDLSPVEKALAEAIAEEYLGVRRKVEMALKRFDVEVVNVGPDDFLPIVIREFYNAKKLGKGMM